MSRKMKTMSLIAALLTSSFLFSGCFKALHRVEGNHNVVSEDRYLGSFDRVYNEGEFEVYIIQDSLSMVTIEAESNLIPFIRTVQKGSSVTIDTRDNLRNHYPMRLYIHTPDITEVRLSGSGRINADSIITTAMNLSLSGSGEINFNVNADAVSCDISGSGSAHMGVVAGHLSSNISGSGSMEFWGTADRGDFKISGSGSVYAYDLSLLDCYATISGSGNMKVNVEDHLDVTISGSGNVYYMGNPSVNTHISGSGSVIHP
jgi:hypothetical protein